MTFGVAGIDRDRLDVAQISAWPSGLMRRQRAPAVVGREHAGERARDDRAPDPTARCASARTDSPAMPVKTSKLRPPSVLRATPPPLRRPPSSRPRRRPRASPGCCRGSCPRAEARARAAASAGRRRRSGTARPGRSRGRRRCGVARVGRERAHVAARRTDGASSGRARGAAQSARAAQSEQRATASMRIAWTRRAVVRPDPETKNGARRDGRAPSEYTPIRR